MTQPGDWTEIELAGHPCEVYEPPQRNPHGYAVLYLHGVHLQRLRDFPVFTRLLAEHGLPCMAPRTGRCWWLDRICPDFDPHQTPQQYVLSAVLPAMRERWAAAPPRIGLLGTSMGGQGALRLALQFPDTFPVVAAIAPAIDFHQRIEEGDEILGEIYQGDTESARQDTALLQIHALHWPRNLFFCCDPTDLRWFEGVERLRMKLSALGIPFECDLETQAGGHGFGYYQHQAPKAFEFLLRGLNHERLRVGGVVSGER